MRTLPSLPVLALLLAACGADPSPGPTTSGGGGGGGGSAGSVGLVLALGNQSDPTSLAFDGAHHVYLACGAALCRVDLGAASPSLTTVAGAAGEPGSNDGASAEARFASITGLAWDGARFVYVADEGNHTVRRVDTQGGATFGAVSTVTGAAGEAGNADGPAAAARFQHPMGLAHDGARSLYVAEWSEIPMGNVIGYAGTLRRIDTQAGATFGAVETLAGDPAEPGTTNGTGSTALFTNPTGLAPDRAGHLYVTDLGAVRRLALASGAVITVAGSTAEVVDRSVDGVGSEARFLLPVGLTFDPAGWLYVADEEDATVRRVDLRAGPTYAAVTTAIGASGERADSAEGTLASARLNMPASVAWLGDRALLVLDTYGNRLLRAEGL